MYVADTATKRATRWRKLLPDREALLVVAYLREGETYVNLAVQRAMYGTEWQSEPVGL